MDDSFMLSLKIVMTDLDEEMHLHDRRGENTCKHRQQRPQLQIAINAAHNTAGHAEPGKRSKKPRRRKKALAQQNASVILSEEEYSNTPLWLQSLEQTQGKALESGEQRLHAEILAFTSYMGATREEQSAKQQVYTLVTDMLQSRFRGCEVHLFGSNACNLSLPDGDIDISVYTRREMGHDEMKNSLFRTSHMFKDIGLIDSARVIHSARVPIISFQTKSDLGSFSFDINFNHVDGVNMVPVVKKFISDMPALRYLLMSVKSLLSQHQLNSASNGGLSSFALLCMVISLLQINPFNRPPAFINTPLESESLGCLLIDFFHYYGLTFPYDTSYISITERKLLFKTSANWIQRGDPPGRLVIQSIVDPATDISKSASRIDEAKVLFKQTYTALDALRSANAVEENYLGRIIKLSKEMITRRQLVEDLVRSGSLTREIKKVEDVRAQQRYTQMTQRPPLRNSRDSHRSSQAHVRHPYSYHSGDEPNTSYHRRHQHR